MEAKFLIILQTLTKKKKNFSYQSCNLHPHRCFSSHFSFSSPLVCVFASRASYVGESDSNPVAYGLKLSNFYADYCKPLKYIEYWEQNGICL